ncbi:MAG: AAA family ATPase [Actinomycetia bacterium]|nr:AAA family ATPase [Actinomycetes bacterium]
MLTVCVAAAADVLNGVAAAVRNTPGAVLVAAAEDLRTGLAQAEREAAQLLVVDDRLLADNPGLLGRVRAGAWTVVLLTRGADAEVLRRTVAVGAAEVVEADRAAEEIGGKLALYVAQESPERTEVGRVLTVFSSKGGVGKTTIAVNLAVALGKLARRPAALVDLDLEFGDASALLGQVPRATLHDLMAVPHLDQPVLERVMPAVAGGAVAFLAAPGHPSEAEDVRPDVVAEVLGLLRRMYSFVVVDTAPGFRDVNVTALDAADLVLTVLTPDVVTVRTVKQVLDLFADGLRYPPEKVRLVLNRAGTAAGLELPDIAGVLGQAVAWELPSDGAWPVRAANQGQPLVLFRPDSRLAQALRSMARTLVEEQEGRRRTVKERAGGRGGFFARFRR